MPAWHLKLGSRGEDHAASFLKTKGFRIRERNWRKRGLELDLVAMHGDTLVFVEVKTRSSTTLGRPVDGVDRAKRERLCRAAALYLSEKGLWDTPCRFDILSITSDPQGQLSPEHLENAFEWCVKGGWQPF